MRGWEEEPDDAELDADIIETGTTQTQRDRVRDVITIVEELESTNDKGAEIEGVIQTQIDEHDLDRQQVEDKIENLQHKGELYEPAPGFLRTT